MQKSNSRRLFILVSSILLFTNITIYAQEVTSSGALTYTYPLNLPAGRNGVAPNLSLVYNSGAGNGMLGVGWSLGGLSIITRDSSYPINFVDTGTGADHFLLDGQKLLMGCDHYYHTEKESYAQIQILNTGFPTAYWLVTLKNGTKMYYGYTDADHTAGNDGNITAIDKSPYALVWCLSKVEDVNGNYYTIEYSENIGNAGTYYPAKITYTKHTTTTFTCVNTVEFWYDNLRTDTGAIYVPTYLNLLLRLKYIAVKTKDPTTGNNNLVRLYGLTYEQAPNTGRSRLLQIKEYGSDTINPYAVNVNAVVVNPEYQPGGSALPPTKFTYTGTGNAALSSPADLGSSPAGSVKCFADVNGDGILDMVSVEQTISGTVNDSLYVYPGFKGDPGVSAPGFGSKKLVGVTSGSRANSNPVIKCIGKDINRDGKAEILLNDTQDYYIHIFQSDAYFNFTDIGSYYMGTSDFIGLEDIEGNGLPDMIERDPYTAATYIWRNTGTGFSGILVYIGNVEGMLYFADVNGDGKTDMCGYNPGEASIYVGLSNGSTFAHWSWSQTLFDVGHDEGDGIHFADVNGDGRADLISKGHPGLWNAGYFYVALSKATSTGNTFEGWTWNSGQRMVADTTNLFLTDINGDGKSDIIAWIPGDGNVTVYPANQNGSYGQGITTYTGITDTDIRHFFITDIVCDGKSDFVNPNSNGHITVCFGDYGVAVAPDILSDITTSAGGTIFVVYETPINAMPQVPGVIDPSRIDPANHKISNTSTQNLVSWICYFDGLGNKMQIDYEYANHLCYTGYTYERADLGFEFIKQKDHNTGACTKTYYYQDKPYEGLVKKVEQYYNSSASFYMLTEHKYSYRTINVCYPGIYFIYKTADYTYNFIEATNGTPVTYRVRYCANPNIPDANYYDYKGNLLEVDNDGDLSTTEDDSKVITEWASNTTKNIYVPKHIIKTAKKLGEATGTTATEIKLCYDGQSYGGTIDKGLLTEKDTYTDATNYIAVINTYDNYGNLQTYKDCRASGGEYGTNPRPTTASYTYDPNYQTYLLTEWNALLQTTTVGYDSLIRPIQVTDANGQVWKTAYDVFGRVVQTASPGDDVNNTQNPPTKQFVYADTTIVNGYANLYIARVACEVISSPGYVQSIVKQDATVNISTYSYCDGLGRLIQTKSQQTEVSYKLITVDYFYDSSGRNYKTSVPYLPSTTGADYTPPDTTQKCVENTYDDIGRMTKITNTDGTYSRMIYGKQRIVSIDENGHATSKEASGNAVTEKSYESVYNDPSYPGSSTTAYYWAQTTAAWNGVRITDKAGSTISTVCDMLGRKTGYSDPDMGTWTYAYDKNGNLTSQTDAKNQNITFEYDKLNRITKKKYGGADKAVYVYGDTNAPANKKGRLLSVTTNGDIASSESYGYDERGRVISITIVINGNSKVYAYAYNSADQLVTETYPTGEALAYIYDSAGQLDRVLGTKSDPDGWTDLKYAKDIGYTTLNKLKEITYANGVKTTYDYYDDADANGNSSSEADASNGNRHFSYRLRNIHVQKQDGTKLADTVYQYDAADNIMKKTFTQDPSYGIGYTEDFTYDYANRLSSVNANGFYQNQSYTYDTNNNFLTKDNKYYVYGSSRPHAVTEIRDTNQGGATLYTYTYDPNGNMTNATGHSTITINAKKTGDQNPKMELWFGNIQYMVWNVTNTDYHSFTWNGLLKLGSQIRIRLTGGGDTGHLFVNSVKANGMNLLSTETEITYSAEWTNGTDVSTLNRNIQYNYDNKVSSITENRGSTNVNSSSFAYDYSGARIYKSESVNGATTTTYYFGAKYEEQTSGGTMKKISYYFQNGQRIAQRTDDGTTNEVLYYSTDHLGSAVRLTDSTGNPVQSIAYAPYGETVFYAGIKDPQFQFTGQELDAPSGLYYYGARYYCPEIGRFIQPDTVLDGLNRYAYCWNNPMNYTDPTGNATQPDIFNAGSRVDGGNYTGDNYGSGSGSGGSGGSNSGGGGGGSGPSVNGVPLQYTNTDEAGNRGYIDQNGNRYMVREDDGLLYMLNPNTAYSNSKNSRWDLVTIDDTQIAEQQTVPIVVGSGVLTGATSATANVNIPGNNGGGAVVTYVPERDDGTNAQKTDHSKIDFKAANSWCNFLSYDKLIDMDRNPQRAIVNGMTAYGLYKAAGVTTTTEPLPNTMGLAWMWMENADFPNPGHVCIYVRNGNSNKYTLWYSRGYSNFIDYSLDIGQIDFVAENPPQKEGTKKIEFMPFNP